MPWRKPEYIMARLKEPSTWAAVCLLAGYIGYTLDAQKLMGGAVAVLTLIGIVWKKDSQAGGK